MEEPAYPGGGWSGRHDDPDKFCGKEDSSERPQAELKKKKN